jgi:hypothetical protein
MPKIIAAAARRPVGAWFIRARLIKQRLKIQSQRRCGFNYEGHIMPT